jgi:superfamily II RNA helicase
MIVPMYEWCNGCEFRSLYMFTDRLEGSIVRSINKVEKFIESLRYLYISKRKKEIAFKLE